jgi:hypothetical protein
VRCVRLLTRMRARARAVQAVIEARVCPRLVELLRHEAYTVQTPALRCIGNIVTGDDTQTQHIIDLGALSVRLLCACVRVNVVCARRRCRSC